MKKILITGGAGFVGSNLARCLLQKGDYEIIVLDNLHTGRLSNLEGLDVEFVEGSVTDEALLQKLIAGKDTVFHLATRNIYQSVDHPADDLQTNVMGTFLVFWTCKELGVERVVFSSNSSVYGNNPHLPTSEEDKPNLLTFYSTSKISAEAYAECFLNNYGLKISIVRYSNCFGPNQHQDNPYSGVIGKFIGRALRNEPLVIHDDGLQTRDFTYIDDACEATIEAAINPNAIGKIYNIGTGVETTINELAETVIAETKTASLIEREPPRPVDTIKRRVLDISLVQKDLGWQPTTSLAEGIRLAIEWEKTQLAPEGENSQRAVI